jgi:hypothetical protein
MSCVEAGDPGVDDRYLAGLLDQVCVDHAVAADPVDARRDLHDGILRSAGQWAACAAPLPPSGHAR